MTVQSCPHKEDGWCLSCAEEMVDDLDKTLMELHTRRENFEIMTKRLIEKENELAVLSWARWVPVSERLPEVSENFLVRITDGQTIWHDVGLYSRTDNKWWYSVSFEQEQSVTHWMPLPLPLLGFRDIISSIQWLSRPIDSN